MASGLCVDKIKDLLNDADLKVNEQNINAIKATIKSLQHYQRQKHRVIPTSLSGVLDNYSVRMIQDGQPPYLFKEYDKIYLSEEEIVKFMRKFNGRSTTNIYVTENDFDLHFVVDITYKREIVNHRPVFSNINVHVAASSEGEPSDPIDQVVFEAFVFYQEYSRASWYTNQECNVEQQILACLDSPAPVRKEKRARIE
jgi:hypothetical protein